MERGELRPILRQKFPPERAYLLPALHYLQHELGHLPEWALQVVGWHLRVPASEVYGAATSYTELRITAPPRHRLRVCAGLSCWHGGGKELLAQLAAHLGVAPGAANPEARVTLEETPCAFLCPLAPAVEVDGRWQGRATAPDLFSLVDGLE